VLGNGVAGTLGIVLQLVLFAMVVLSVTPRHGLSRSLVYGGVIAVYGYSLVIGFLLLVAVPWQVANVLLAIAVGALFLVGSVRRAVLAGIAPVLGSVRSSWAAVAIVAAILLFQVFVTAIEPELSIDGQLYHGPALANIVQSGSLWGWPVPNQYVYYTDLTMTGGVNLATFTGDARFDDALQVPHLLILIFIINWALSGRIRSPFARVALAALIVSAPVIWLQPRILYVDVAYGAAVAGAVFMIVLVRQFRILDIVVAGVLVSAVFATKPTGILTGLLLLAAVVIAILFRRRGLAPWRSTIGALLAGMLVPLVMGTAAFVRNFVQFGNPVYPVQASFGPITLPGILDLSIFASGERGNGLVDPSRWFTYARNIGWGMTHGVTKLDYDPREGGFGYVPLLVLVIALALIAMQFRARMRDRRAGGSWFGNWKPQVAAILIAAAILLVQPSTFDARYVIGPTVVLLTAALMTSVTVLPSGVAVVAGVVAVVLAFGQVVWTERSMFPGLNVALYLSQAPADAQPLTPGNPWGTNTRVAWMPTDAGDCISIAVQTAGGVTASGMSETSYLGTFTYGLYGQRLCNQVFPVTMGSNGKPTESEGLGSADYLVLYEDDLEKWERVLPDLEHCYTVVQSVDGDETYPEDETVLRNTCS